MKPLLPALMLIMLPTLALAQYTGPSAQPQVTTAAAAANAADDTQVVLEGKLISQISNDTYWFQDQTGKIRVDIDRKRLPAEPINHNTRVRLRGEVDKHLTKATEVDVDQVEILH